jgi:hypothetical protein
MDRRDRITYAITGCTAASVGYTLVTSDRAADTLPGIALLAAASLHYEQSAAPEPTLAE